ncbi:MBL fold metallo-hydrolase [Spongiactinospora rosea]|nr:MBL fold metallo-hydrolase [Spongiactinospora rosea]
MPEPELHEVADGVFAYVQPDGGWMLNNTGLVLDGAGGHVLVDTTSTEARNRALLARVAEVAGEGPPRALVNTHHHGDHTYGNRLLPAATPVIGHVHCREDVLAAGLVAAEVLSGPAYGELRLRPPELTFETRMALHTGERRIDLLHAGPAHTRGDVIAWLPEERVAFAGDVVVNGGQPFLVEGSVAGHPRALAMLRELDPLVLVPGHGPICRGEEVRRVLDDLVGYAALVDGLARYGHKTGAPPLTMARAAARELGPFSDWTESERLVGNLHRAYHELDGNPPGSPLALARVWPDMVTVNGGPILSNA